MTRKLPNGIAVYTLDVSPLRNNVEPVRPVPQFGDLNLIREMRRKAR
jgi:hypothetical protein